MGKTITSLADAREEAERLKEVCAQFTVLSEEVTSSVDAINRFLDQFSEMIGGGARGPRASASLLGEAVSQGASMKPARGGLRAPATIIERVLEIMLALEGDLARPLWPKDVEREYLLRSWPSPKKGTLYNLISGTFGYLTNSKGALVKSADGYRLLHKDIGKLMNMPTKRTRPSESPPQP
jgi:hypothetical protein